MTGRNDQNEDSRLLVVPSKDDEDRATRRVSLLEIASFITIGIVGLACAAIFTSLSWMFITVVVVDGVGTLLQVDRLLAVDRSILFLVAVVSSILRGTALLQVSAEILFLFVVLDISFFLRRIGDTRADATVLGLRFQSYLYTVVPAFLLTFVLALLVSLVPLAVPVQSALLLLGASSVGIFFTIWLVLRQLAAFRKGGETGT